jgi:predicted alpha/beta hydrolase family esterase
VIFVHPLGFIVILLVALRHRVRFIDAGAAGHINVDSGHGPWPEGSLAFANFMAKL